MGNDNMVIKKALIKLLEFARTTELCELQREFERDPSKGIMAFAPVAITIREDYNAIIEELKV